MKGNRLYWVTGLAGSGKSTLANHLVTTLRNLGKQVIFLDGDALREVFQEEADYSQGERLRIAWRNARLCKFLTDQGVTVVCATISLFHEIQNWNRENIRGYCEIFLDVPMEDLIKRDQKGLYSGFKKGYSRNIVGIDILPQFPLHPDYRITTADDINLVTSKMLGITPD